MNFGSWIEDSMNLGADNLLESTEKVGSRIDQLVQEFAKSQEEAVTATRRKIEESVADNTETMNQSMQRLDAAMQEQLQRALNLMGNNLTAITEQFVSTYEQTARQVINLSNEISRADRTNRPR